MRYILWPGPLIYLRTVISLYEGVASGKTIKQPWVRKALIGKDNFLVN